MWYEAVVPVGYVRAGTLRGGSFMYRIALFWGNCPGSESARTQIANSTDAKTCYPHALRSWGGEWAKNKTDRAPARSANTRPIERKQRGSALQQAEAGMSVGRMGTTARLTHCSWPQASSVGTSHAGREGAWAVMFWVCLFWVCLLFVGAAEARPVSSEDQQLIIRIERYINTIRNLSARFAQIADGRYSEGRIWLSRPGGMRFEYAPPSQIVLIANGDVVMLQDDSFGQKQVFSASDYPQITILTRRSLQFGRDLIITDLKQSPGIIEVVTNLPNGSEYGKLTLHFSDTPLELRKWTTIDPQGVEITVALLEVDLHSIPDPRLFVIPAVQGQ